MDFELTADQREIQALAREIAETEIVPNAPAWDREHRFPAELLPKLAELGLMGVCVPEEYGGAGADFLSYILVLEELSRADAGVGVTVAVHTSATTLPILRFGTEEQKELFVPLLARGEKIGAFALTEPSSGSDAGSLKTRAEPDDDGWTLTGSKQWITNGSVAGTFLLFARTDTSHSDARGISCFLLDADHVRITREEEKLGLNSSTTSDLVLEGSHVDHDRLLHEEGRGFRVAMAASESRRRPWASHRPHTTSRMPTRSSVSSSDGRSRNSRRSSGSSPTWRRRSKLPVCSPIALRGSRSRDAPIRPRAPRRSSSPPRWRAGRLPRRSRFWAAKGTRRNFPSSVSTATRR
jgi:alkylation response protein AidB-like acyl-CoA dehydrogenase